MLGLITWMSTPMASISFSRSVLSVMRVRNSSASAAPGPATAWANSESLYAKSSTSGTTIWAWKSMTTGFAAGPLRRTAPREDLAFLTRAVFFGAGRVPRLVDVFCFLADFFAMGSSLLHRAYPARGAARQRCTADAGPRFLAGSTGVPGLQRIAIGGLRPPLERRRYASAMALRCARDTKPSFPALLPGLFGQKVAQAGAHLFRLLGRPAAKTFAAAHAELAGLDLLGQERMGAGRAVEVLDQHVTDVKREVETDQIRLLGRAEHRHARPKALLHHGVESLGIAGAGGDQRDRLALERVLQAVADEAGNVLAHVHRLLAGLAQQRDGALDGGGAGPLVLDHLDQRHQVRRIPEMRADHTLAVLELARDLGGRDGRAVAGQDGVGRGVMFQVGKNLLLERQLFRRRLEHELHVAHGGRQPMVRRDAVEYRAVVAEQLGDRRQTRQQRGPHLGRGLEDARLVPGGCQQVCDAVTPGPAAEDAVLGYPPPPPVPCPGRPCVGAPFVVPPASPWAPTRGAPTCAPPSHPAV